MNILIRVRRLLLTGFCTAILGTAGATTNGQPLVIIETVPVGNPGNPKDPQTGFGTVSYEYEIGKYVVTVGQYLAFLNAKAAVTTNPALTNLWNEDMQEPAGYVSAGFIKRTGTGTQADPFLYAEIPDAALGTNSSNRAICNISWFSAARFANWMNNGATKDADTESGAYALQNATSGVFIKEKNAKWWIPSEDEWYKAAYYDPTKSTTGGYHTYSFRSDAEPKKEVPPGGVNSANYDGIMPDKRKITPVGAYTHSKSYYGTFDQGGLVWQWNDAVYSDQLGKPLNRGMRGASWSLGLLNISKLSPRDYPPTYEDDDSGFRLACSPAAATSSNKLKSIEKDPANVKSSSSSSQ
jgi:formylglycine-generating enzyme required for sulfatase activity